MKIYLAVPYSSNLPFVKESRFLAVNRYAAYLMERGDIVYSPISHTHPISAYTKLSRGWEFWKKQDFPHIEWADVVYVLALPGWEDSIGVREEIEYARSLGKPIVIIDRRAIEKALYGGSLNEQ